MKIRVILYTAQIKFPQDYNTFVKIGRIKIGRLS